MNVCFLLARKSKNHKLMILFLLFFILFLYLYLYLFRKHDLFIVDIKYTNSQVPPMNSYFYYLNDGIF